MSSMLTYHLVKLRQSRLASETSCRFGARRPLKKLIRKLSYKAILSSVWECILEPIITNFLCKLLYAVGATIVQYAQGPDGQLLIPAGSAYQLSTIGGQSVVMAASGSGVSEEASRKRELRLLKNRYDCLL